jgi:hypothetical protein
MRWMMLLFAMAAWAQEPGLLNVHRIFVQEFTGGKQAEQIHDMVIASLQRTGQVAITEDLDKADAVLKGSAEDATFTDVFDTSDGISANVRTGTPTTGTGSTLRRGTTAGFSVGDRDTTRIQERKHEASASVRLVNRDGDVLWSTTQESLGAKFRGSSADVADRVAKQFVADLDKLRRASAAPPQSPAPAVTPGNAPARTPSPKSLNANSLPR